MSHNLPSPSLPVPSWSAKMEASREYRETPATPLTLTLPLWSLNLNWLNELPIWEALVTAYWCVHRTPVCAPNGGDKIPSLVVCFPFSFLFCPSSASLHFCPTTSLAQSTQKFNKLLHRHWSLSHTNICMGVGGGGGSKAVRWRCCLFISVEKRSCRWWELDLWSLAAS